MYGQSPLIPAITRAAALAASIPGIGRSSIDGSQRPSALAVVAPSPVATIPGQNAEPPAPGRPSTTLLAPNQGGKLAAALWGASGAAPPPAPGRRRGGAMPRPTPLPPPVTNACLPAICSIGLVRSL